MSGRAGLFSVLLAALTAPVVLADDVHLTNGGVFEGVVVETQGARVAHDADDADAGVVHIHIHLPTGGRVTLPRSQVARIEERESILEQFLARKATLQATAAEPLEWLALARWARMQELAAYREITLLVAELDPLLPDLAPLMRGLGYSLDAELERWLHHDQLMRRRGLVELDGEWVTAEERGVRLAARREAMRAAMASEQKRMEEAAAARATSEEATGNELAMAQLELFRDVLATLDRGLPGFVYLGHGSIFSGGTLRGGIHPHASGGGGTLTFQAAPAGASPWDAFLGHQPGSFLPIRSPR